MIWKFGDAMLPCNEKKDFESKNIAMDIVCRVYLSEAPNEDLEKDAKELDGEFYNKECFFIEAIAGRNDPEGAILTSGWGLYYIAEDGEMHELDYIEEIDGAWEFFKEKMEVGF